LVSFRESAATSLHYNRRQTVLSARRCGLQRRSVVVVCTDVNRTRGIITFSTTCRHRSGPPRRCYVKCPVTSVKHQYVTIISTFVVVAVVQLVVVWHVCTTQSASSSTGWYLNGRTCRRRTSDPWFDDECRSVRVRQSRQPSRRPGSNTI